MNSASILMALLLCAGPAAAEMAVETSPGVTWFGDSLAVETTPGVTWFSGAVDGLAVQVSPGITSYSLRANDFYGDLEREIVADGARRAQRMQEALESNQRDRDTMDRFFRSLSGREPRERR